VAAQSGGLGQGGAIALGLKAVHAGYRVYYTTAADLVARTAKAALDGRWQTTMRFWNGPQLLVIDLGRHRDYADPSRGVVVNCLRPGGFADALPARLSA
jgi:hypothetical protein